MTKNIYMNDEDKMMRDKSLTWSKPAIMSKDLKDVYVNNQQCKTCDDKYFINSNDKNGNSEIQKCDDCNYFKSDKEAQNHQKTNN